MLKSHTLFKFSMILKLIYFIIICIACFIKKKGILYLLLNSYSKMLTIYNSCGRAFNVSKKKRTREGEGIGFEFITL